MDNNRYRMRVRWCSNSSEVNAIMFYRWLNN